jgi:hypothetical protein
MTMPARRRLLSTALALATLLGVLPMAAHPQAAAPADNVYHVEIIVFRATSGPASGEDWSAPAGRGVRASSVPGDAGERTAGAAQVGRFAGALPAAQWQLNDLAAKLGASGGYQPLAHVAWAQTASSWNSRAGFTLERLGVNVPGLSGIVYLERGTYLHLGMALKYATGSDGPTYSLAESRRVKFYERNYYDHPAYGVIALVTPAQGARPAGR